MAMKIKPEHIEALEKVVSPFYSEAAASAYKAAGLSDKRYRWDALWAASDSNAGFGALMSEIYQYANDEHIDTVLRKLSGNPREPNGHLLIIYNGETLLEVPVFAGESISGTHVDVRARSLMRKLRPLEYYCFNDCIRRYIPVPEKG